MSCLAMWLAALVSLALAMMTPAVANKGSANGSQIKAKPLPAAVSALSAEEIAGLKAGRGLGFALAAELNDHPGPLHVLELAGELRITPEQRARVQAIYDAMKRKAIVAGLALIAAEERLADSFKSGAAQSVTLGRLVRQAEEARADLRLIHLSAHLETTPILSAEQRRRYRELRPRPAGHPGGAPHKH